MAKRELSSTLKNLKFMQRASAKKEEKPKEEEAEMQVMDAFGSTSTAALSKKCIVIMEGNPCPGAVRGRISFQSFNPSIDKLNQEAACSHKVRCSASGAENLNATTCDRSDEHPLDNTIREDSENLSDLKRKQPEVETETSNPQNSQENITQEGNSGIFSHNRKRSSHKQQKREKLDWNVLRPSKAQSRKGAN